MEKTRADLIKDDMQAEWWRASDTDQYSLRDKLLRVGCRPLKRKYLACKKTMTSGQSLSSIENYGECMVSSKFARLESEELIVMLMLLDARKFEQRWMSAMRCFTICMSRWLKSRSRVRLSSKVNR